MMRVVFFGTPELSVPFLKALAADCACEVVGVVTQPDRPSGRGHRPLSSPIKDAALALGLALVDMDDLPALQADFFVVMAYGKIIKKNILALPRLGCLNVHPSLLPRWRGPSPMIWAIREGDTETGITIMLMDEGMDTGPILAHEKIHLDSDETLTSLTHKVMEKGPALLLETMKKYAHAEIHPQAQDDACATYSKLLDRADGELDWSRPCDEIDRFVRAYHPWPGTWTMVEHRGKPLRLKILEVRCVNGSLDILRVQPEGGKPMAWDAFARGYPDVRLQKRNEK